MRLCTLYAIPYLSLSPSTSSFQPCHSTYLYHHRLSLYLVYSIVVANYRVYLVSVSMSILYMIKSM